MAPTPFSTTISGVYQEGQILTAAVNNAPVGSTLTYQWQILIGSTWTNISGANSAGLMLTESDENHQVRVLTTAVVGSTHTTATSNVSDPIADEAPTISSATITGQAMTGRILTAHTTGTQTDNPTSYQWQTSTDGTTWTNLSATGSTYTIAEADDHDHIRVVATSTNEQGATVSLASSGTIAVVDAPPVIGRVNIIGTPQEDQTLTAQLTGTHDGETITYQWQSLTGSAWSNIGGATGSTYTATEGDEGHSLRLVATATNTDGAHVSVTSASTGVVTDAPPTIDTPTITGLAEEGHTLTAHASGNESDDPITYQWQFSYRRRLDLDEHHRRHRLHLLGNGGRRRPRVARDRDLDQRQRPHHQRGQLSDGACARPAADHRQCVSQRHCPGRPDPDGQCRAGRRTRQRGHLPVAAWRWHGVDRHHDERQRRDLRRVGRRRRNACPRGRDLDQRRRRQHRHGQRIDQYGAGCAADDHHADDRRNAAGRPDADGVRRFGPERQPRHLPVAARGCRYLRRDRRDLYGDGGRRRPHDRRGGDVDQRQRRHDQRDQRNHRSGARCAADDHHAGDHQAKPGKARR